MTPPLTILDAIGEIIRPSLLQSGGAIRLEESGEKSTCAAITLTKHGRAVVVKPDNQTSSICHVCRAPQRGSVNERIFGLFDTQQPGLTASCDYIIFYRDDEGEIPTLFVFLCELKSKNIAGAGKQAENGRILADHILAMAQHHRPVPRPQRVLYRGLIFSTSYLPLPKGRLDSSKWPYTPSRERMRDMSVAYLPCGGTYPLRHFCA